MNNETYNNWTNYATWRVNLELIDSDYYCTYLGNNFFEDELKDKDTMVYSLSQTLKSDTGDYLEQSSNDSDSIVLSYALAFIDDVNWYEIAEHIYNDFMGV